MLNIFNVQKFLVSLKDKKEKGHSICVPSLSSVLSRSSDKVFKKRSQGVWDVRIAKVEGAFVFSVVHCERVGKPIGYSFFRRRLCQIEKI